MMEKIELYKEVMELEPNSKLFLPLARLLNNADRPDEAAEVLERGLERHDDFLEARLFLIELLHKSGKSEDCDRQIEKLGDMLSAYAGFWQAWAAYMSKKSDAQDASAVMHFLAACFACGPLSLHEVIVKGTKSLMQDGVEQKTGTLIQSAVNREPQLSLNLSSSQEQGNQVPLSDAGKKSDITYVPVHTVLPAEETFLAEQEADLPFAGFDNEFFDSGMAVAKDVPMPEAETQTEQLSVAPLTVIPPQVEDCEERFSLRTRSMAEVLAEQGDIQGALDIYHELTAVTTGKEELADLQQRIATLSAHLNSQETSIVEMPLPAETANGKDKLIHILGALAERVEARVQG